MPPFGGGVNRKSAPGYTAWLRAGPGSLLALRTPLHYVLPPRSSGLPGGPDLGAGGTPEPPRNAGANSGGDPRPSAAAPLSRVGEQGVGLDLHVFAIEHRGGRRRGAARDRGVGAARQRVAAEGPRSPEGPLYPRFPLSARSVQEHPRPRASPAGAGGVVSRRCFGGSRSHWVSPSDRLALGRATGRFSLSQLENRLGVIRLIILLSVCAECRGSR